MREDFRQRKIRSAIATTKSSFVCGQATCSFHQKKRRIAARLICMTGGCGRRIHALVLEIDRRLQDYFRRHEATNHCMAPSKAPFRMSRSENLRAHSSEQHLSGIYEKEVMSVAIEVMVPRPGLGRIVGEEFTSVRFQCLGVADLLVIADNGGILVVSRH